MGQIPHKLFIDDSGDKDYTKDNRYGPVGIGPTPYFVFGGLIIPVLEANGIDQSMRSLKRRTFGTAEVEIKANWLRRHQERTERYLKKYNVTDAALSAFVNELYSIIEEAECQLIACVVNKAETKQLYGENAHHPAAIAYDCLLQRAQQEMAARGGDVHVTVDAMTGATPAGNPHLQLLKRQHARLKNRGSALQRGMVFDRIGNVSFRDSKLDERLQLADLVAYAVYRQFMDYGPQWEKPEKPLPTYEYFGRIAPKFRNHQG